MLIKIMQVKNKINSIINYLKWINLINVRIKLFLVTKKIEKSN
jgi:hypothetical protein